MRALTSIVAFLVVAGLNFLWWWVPNRPVEIAGWTSAPLQSVSFAPYRPGQSPLTRTFPTPDQIEATLKHFQYAPKYQPIPLKQDITPDEQAFIEAHRNELPELETLDEQRRLYPRDGFAAHVIGYVGESGRATGPHLHYEVRLHNVPVNPYKYLRVTYEQATNLYDSTPAGQ